MRKGQIPAPKVSADSRPRIYVRCTVGGRAAWRVGMGGLENPAADAGAALNAAIETFGANRPLVIFWEGATDD